MTQHIRSLLKIPDTKRPWLYMLEYESVIDVNEDQTMEGWQHRVEEISRRKRSVTLWERATLIVAALLAAVIILFGTDALLIPVGTVMLAAMMTGYIATTVRYRKSKAGLIVGAPATQLQKETLKLGTTLATVHELVSADLSELHIPDGFVAERVNPDAMEDMARTLLEIKFPDVDAEYVKSVREDIEKSLHTTTGLRIDRK